MSDGSCFRVNEFRRIGHPGTERLQVFGTEGCFECNSGAQVWLTKNRKDQIRLDDLLKCCSNEVQVTTGGMEKVTAGGTHLDVAKVHPISRLPKEFKGLPNGHNGSHQFLVDDFVRSCVENALPPNNVWQAARYLIPGLIAHESAKRGGELLKVPDLGSEPAGWKRLG
jgi:hypothetical protein